MRYCPDNDIVMHYGYKIKTCEAVKMVGICQTVILWLQYCTVNLSRDLSWMWAGPSSHFPQGGDHKEIESDQ